MFLAYGTTPYVSELQASNQISKLNTVLEIQENEKRNEKSRKSKRISKAPEK